MQEELRDAEEKAAMHSRLARELYAEAYAENENPYKMSYAKEHSDMARDWEAKAKAIRSQM